MINLHGWGKHTLGITKQFCLLFNLSSFAIAKDDKLGLVAMPGTHFVIERYEVKASLNPLKRLKAHEAVVSSNQAVYRLTPASLRLPTLSSASPERGVKTCHCEERSNDKLEYKEEIDTQKNPGQT